MKRTIPFLLLLFPFVALAQTDFRKGFIIRTNGDTVSGLIDFRAGLKAYTSCIFKSNESAEIIEYTPDKLSGYGFTDDRQFQSLNVVGEDSPQFFFELLVKGTISLYRDLDFYFLRKDEKLYKLENTVSVVQADGRFYKKNSNKHLGIITMLMNDCSSMRVKKAELSQKSLIKLTQSYNACMGEKPVTYKSKTPLVKFIPGINAGVSFSNLSFETTNKIVNGYLMGSVEKSTAAIYGVSINMSAPRLNEKISFQIEVLYNPVTYYMFTTSQEPEIDPVLFQRNYMTIDFKQLKIPLGFRFDFPGKKISPYVQAGISATIHLKSSVTRREEVESAGFVRSYDRESFEVRDNQFGFWGGVGILTPVYKKISVFAEFRYERTDGVNKSLPRISDLSSKISNFQIFAGLRLR